MEGVLGVVGRVRVSRVDEVVRVGLGEVEDVEAHVVREVGGGNVSIVIRVPVSGEEWRVGGRVGGGRVMCSNFGSVGLGLLLAGRVRVGRLVEVRVEKSSESVVDLAVSRVVEAEALFHEFLGGCELGRVFGLREVAGVGGSKQLMARLGVVARGLVVRGVLEQGGDGRQRVFVVRKVLA